MGIRNRKGVVRSIFIAILGYGGDIFYSLCDGVVSIAQGVRAVINPEYAKKIHKEMDP